MSRPAKRPQTDHWCHIRLHLGVWAVGKDQEAARALGQVAVDKPVDMGDVLVWITCG